MHVELIDTMGADLTVVNAARVSFNKHHDKFTTSDEKLIAYLARHGHWTPLVIHNYNLEFPHYKCETI